MYYQKVQGGQLEKLATKICHEQLPGNPLHCC